MPDAGPPTPIKFPVKSTAAAPALSLRRRASSPIELSAASAEARKQIAQIVSATRTPWGGEPKALDGEQISALERSLRALEQGLEERERAIEETETKQIERERDLAEAEALLIAREQLVAATRKKTQAQAASTSAAPKAEVSKEEQAALEQLKAALDKQEESLKEQKAALEAVQGSQDSIPLMLAEYRKRRDFVIARLRTIPGVKITEPKGAFYAYPNVSVAFRNGIDSAFSFTEKLLAEAHVAVVPGEAFGTDQHVRISYATSMKELERGLDRIDAFIRKYSA